VSTTSAPNGTVVLAYSGGLDTSALIPWLKEQYGYDVVACLIDAGRVKDIPAIMERATASGAIAAVAIDAKEEFAEHYCLPALIETIDVIGNTHGFGRVDMIENRLVGIKSREVYEVAGSLALITAHRELEDLVLTRDLLHFKRSIEAKLADMIYEGQWFDPLTEACKAFLFQSQERVTGDVRLKFYKGTCVADGRQSDFSLYSYTLATYSADDEFTHEAAAGFVQLWGLPIEIWARIGKEHHMMKELEE